MDKDIKHENKCCETCLNRASFSNGKHMCCKDCYEDLSTYGIPKKLPDEHVCDKYSPDIANNPSLREPKPDTEISGFMSIFREIENTDDLPCIDGCTCHECDYFTKEDNRFMIDGVCGYYGIYLYDFVKNAACQHFKQNCCDDNSSDDTNSTAEPYDSYFKSFEAINSDRTDEELADHYDSIDAMFKKDVENGDTDQNHGKKHFCSECIFCAMIEPDEDDQKTMYWAYTWKCLKTNLTLPSPNTCKVCDKFVSKEDEYSNYLKAIEKPPLGIKPPYVFASKRISDICEAILRLNKESVVADTDIIRSHASELCAIRYDEEDYGFFNDDSELYELDKLIYDFKQSLKESVKDEIKEKIKSLESELTELKEFRDMKDSYDRDMQELKFQLDQTKKSIEERAARMRVSDVLLTLKKETWVPDCKWKYIKKKCDKCDDSRTLRFKSPLGKELSERCSCSVQIPVHFPAQAFLVEIDNDDFYKNMQSELPSTKLSYISVFDIDHDSDRNYRFKHCTLYNGEDFSKLPSSSTYFRDREDCERYCKWLNDKYIREHEIEVEVEL